MGFFIVGMNSNLRLLGHQHINIASAIGDIEFAVVSVKDDCNNFVAILVQNDVSIRYQISNATIDELVGLGHGVGVAFHALVLIIVDRDEYAVVSQINVMSNIVGILVSNRACIVAGDRCNVGGVALIAVNNLTNNIDCADKRTVLRETNRLLA